MLVQFFDYFAVVLPQRLLKVRRCFYNEELLLLGNTLLFGELLIALLHVEYLLLVAQIRKPFQAIKLLDEVIVAFVVILRVQLMLDFADIAL